MSWPDDRLTNALFLLRWIHLVSAVIWLGMLVAFLLSVERSLPQLEERTRAQARSALLPRILFWMRWSALAAVLTGVADYVLLLASEGLWPRIFVFLAAWFLAWSITASLLKLSASKRALADGRALALVLMLLLGIVAWSGDFYMRRGGSHKTIALSLGGGLALLMFFNSWFLLDPAERSLLENGEGAADVIRDERLAFLVSRLNAWLIPPVLFLMGAASHFPIFGRRPP